MKRLFARIALFLQRLVHTLLRRKLPERQQGPNTLANWVLLQRLRLMISGQETRSLLAGMTYSLMTGSVPFMTGWERYKHANQKRSYAKGVPARLVGRPVVYKFRDTQIGMTEFHQDYTPRRETLAARGRRKHQ